MSGAVETDETEEDYQQELDRPGPSFVEPTEDLLETVQIIVPETVKSYDPSGKIAAAYLYTPTL